MDFTAIITSNTLIAKNTHRLAVKDVPESAFMKFAPGMFAHIRVPNAPDLLLRRPLAIYRADGRNGEMAFIYQTVGEGTRRLAFAQAGERVLMGAPLGNGFSVPEGTKKGYVVGGGTGCAALLSVASEFPKVKWQAFLGFPNKESVYGEDDFKAAFESVEYYTNDASFGTKGNPTDRLSGEDPADIVLACGPEAMFLALRKALPDKFPCQISVERRMGCGVGACLVCACETTGANGEIVNKRACMDGPVFNLWEVNLRG